jgi:hypothetical protein
MRLLRIINTVFFKRGTTVTYEVYAEQFDATFALYEAPLDDVQCHIWLTSRVLELNPLNLQNFNTKINTEFTLSC